MGVRFQLTKRLPALDVVGRNPPLDAGTKHLYSTCHNHVSAVQKLTLFGSITIAVRMMTPFAWFIWFLSLGNCHLHIGGLFGSFRSDVDPVRLVLLLPEHWEDGHLHIGGMLRS